MIKKYMLAAVLSLTMALSSGYGSNQAQAMTDGAVPGNFEVPGINTEQSHESIWIGGKVRSVSEDSFVLSRTLITENSCVTMPEEGSPEEELVTVRCPDSAVVELLIIQDGGAEIKTYKAKYSDIKKGTVLEAYGYFDGDEFVPERVYLEIDV